MDNEQVTRFTSLWTQTQPAVFAFVSATVTSFSDAEDVLQKVATCAVSKFSEYDESKPFVGWAIGIARIEILRHLRDRATDRHEFVADSLGQIADAFVAVAPELDDRRRALAACLQHVEGRAREVLEKRYSDGLKTGAVAKAIGLTTGNVSVILNRTYRKLRECIDGRLAAERNAS